MGKLHYTDEELFQLFGCLIPDCFTEEQVNRIAAKKHATVEHDGSYWEIKYVG